MEVKFTMLGLPKAKARPFFNRKTGLPFTPAKTVSYENAISLSYQNETEHRFTGAVYITIDFYLPIPASLSKTEKKMVADGLLRPAKRPDIDNLVKSVLDGLNEVCFDDDKQVVSILANKHYGEIPRTEIEIGDWVG
jgi:Holliday junction resolvase RusA-like endonuclease